MYENQSIVIMSKDVPIVSNLNKMNIELMINDVGSENNL